MLLAVFIARAGSDDEGAAEAAIVGTVTLRPAGPDDPDGAPRCADPERALEAFVPTATAATETDDAGDPLTFRGSVEERNGGACTFEIPVGEADTFGLGFERTTEPDGGRHLFWEAEVDPEEVEVEAPDGEVGGVTYTITGVRCEEVA